MGCYAELGWGERFVMQPYAPVVGGLAAAAVALDFLISGGVGTEAVAEGGALFARGGPTILAGLGLAASTPQGQQALQTEGAVVLEEVAAIVPPERAAAAFSNVLNQAEVILQENPDTIWRISRAVNTEGAIPRAVIGKAIHNLTAGLIEAGPLANKIIYVGGASPFDFAGREEFAGYLFEICTVRGVCAHAARTALQQPGAMIFTYDIEAILRAAGLY
jgi:hypothetical protein